MAEYVFLAKARICKKDLSFVQKLICAMEVYKQRQVLARLEPHELRDIGLSEADRGQECARSFWDFG